MHCELDIRAAGVHSDFTHDRQCHVAHHLILAVTERLCGGHRDAVARVDAHRVKVLDGADDDHIVLAIPHHLQFVLLPAKDGLLHQHLARGGGGQSSGNDVVQLFGGVRDAASGTSQRKGRTDDERVGGGFRKSKGILHGRNHRASGHGESN